MQGRAAWRQCGEQGAPEGPWIWEGLDSGVRDVQRGTGFQVLLHLLQVPALSSLVPSPPHSLFSGLFIPGSGPSWGPYCLLGPGWVPVQRPRPMSRASYPSFPQASWCGWRQQWSGSELPQPEPRPPLTHTFPGFRDHPSSHLLPSPCLAPAPTLTWLLGQTV